MEEFKLKKEFSASQIIQPVKTSISASLQQLSIPQQNNERIKQRQQSINYTLNNSNASTTQPSIISEKSPSIKFFDFAFDKQYVNRQEIYNEEMSNTRLIKAYDKLRRKNVIFKYISKQGMNAQEIQQIQDESKCQMKFKHHCLVEAFQIYESPQENLIIMEYLEEADYFVSKIEKSHRAISNELKLKIYIGDILEGLQYIHQQGYIHCDMKLANLMCDKKEFGEVRKARIGDFGLIKKINPETNTAYVAQACGTMGYIAPEIKSKSYITTAADMWSVGIILYFMSVGYLPHHYKKFSKDKSKYVSYRDKDWETLSPECKDFVQKLLQFNAQDRMTIDQAMEHPWLQ